jgi:hypothetical protein
MADSQNTRIASAIPQSPYMRLLELLSRLFAESTPDQLARAAGVFRAEAALALQPSRPSASPSSVEGRYHDAPRRSSPPRLGGALCGPMLALRPRHAGV